MSERTIYEPFLDSYELSEIKNGNMLEEEAARISQYRRNDMARTLSSKHGKRLIWRMLAAGGIFEQTFTGNSSTYFNEGRRAAALDLLSKVQCADPKAFIEMQTDQLEERTRYV